MSVCVRFKVSADTFKTSGTATLARLLETVFQFIWHIIDLNVSTRAQDKGEGSQMDSGKHKHGGLILGRSTGWTQEVWRLGGGLRRHDEILHVNNQISWESEPKLQRH